MRPRHPQSDMWAPCCTICTRPYSELHRYTPSRQLRSSVDIPASAEYHTSALSPVVIKRCSSYHAPTSWHQPPVSVRHATSVSSFKSSLKTFLPQQQQNQTKRTNKKLTVLHFSACLPACLFACLSVCLSVCHTHTHTHTHTMHERTQRNTHTTWYTHNKYYANSASIA